MVERSLAECAALFRPTLATLPPPYGATMKGDDKAEISYSWRGPFPLTRPAAVGKQDLWAETNQASKT